MSIMPVGGWNIESRPEMEGQILPRTSAACPSCQSEEWRSASLVHAEGLTVSAFQTRGNTASVGRIGLRNGQFAVGFGTNRSAMRGLSQTALSSMAAPPRKRNGAVVLMTLLFLMSGCGAVGNLANNGPSMGTFIFMGFTVLFAFLAWDIQRSRKQAYEAAMEIYKSVRMCQRCGTFYTP
ncbi:MAG: hypothetical protein JSS87_15525 [Acidobacteria bacterium]|nr:hypothetical protein [Acidobacteriota bacterium]